MININFTKSLTAGFVLAMAFYPQAFAGVAIPCGQQKGDTSSNCWSCGSDCSARLDSNGKLSIDGSGNMNNYGFDVSNGYLTTAPWNSEINNVTSVEVKGVSSVGSSALIGMRNITTVSILAPVQTLGLYSFELITNLTTVYLAPSVTSVGGGAFSYAPNLTDIYASDDVTYNGSFNNSRQPIKHKTEQNGDLIYIYDSDRTTLIGVYNNVDSFIDKNNVNNQDTFEIDENGNIIIFDNAGNIMKYNSNGILFAQHQKNPDGSTSIYDANGKLTGLKNARSITPAQAAALVKKGNHNTVTLTFK